MEIDMDKKDLLLWLYEQKDKVEDKLFGTNGEDRVDSQSYRDVLYAKQNTYDEVIKYVKKNM